MCRKCNGFHGLMKYYPPHGFIAGDQGWYKPENCDDTDLDKWIKEHEMHVLEDPKFKDTYSDGEYFAFVTEQDEQVKLYDFEHSKILLVK